MNLKRKRTMSTEKRWSTYAQVYPNSMRKEFDSVPQLSDPCVVAYIEVEKDGQWSVQYVTCGKYEESSSGSFFE